jgi:nucleoside-diphosphate-sugar epimerase
MPPSLPAILITGANGFVGSNLYDQFSRDFHLVGLDIVNSGKYPEENFYRWDELDRIPPVDAIIHLAGKAHDTSNTSKEEEYFEVNLGLTQKIFDHFLESDTEKFIFFSSVKAVADTVEGEALNEEVVPKPLTAYGRSKLAAEKYIMKAGKQPHPLNPQPPFPLDPRFRGDLLERGPGGEVGTRNKQIYVLRPAMIHGPGNKGNLNLLYKVVKKGIPWPLGAFDNLRSFASVENVAYVVRQLIEKEIPPGIYHLADDEPISTNNLIRLISSILNPHPSRFTLHASLLNVPPVIIRTIARTGDLLHLPLNSERLKKLTENYVVSNSHLKKALGIDKMPVDAREGLKITLKSFQDS